MPIITDPNDPTESALEVRATGGQSAPILKVTDEHGETLGYFDKHGQVYTYPSWEDLRFPASGFNPAGSTAPPAVDTATGLLSFAGNADNIIGGVAQMPHGWKGGTAIYPHIHLQFPTSNAGKNTRWLFEYDVANVNGVFTNAYGTLTAQTAITVANPASVKKHVIASFAAIDMTGFKGSTCVMWRITRLAASDGADDDTNACILLEFDIHYLADKLGSYTEVPTT